MSLPTLMVLPEGTSADTRIVTVQNPRTSAPCRYLFCPEKGIYEFTKIAAPKSAPRSFLLTRPSRDAPNGVNERGRVDSRADNGDAADLSKEEEVNDGTDVDFSKGYIAPSADLYVATPMDPLFLVLPALAPAPTSRRAEPLKQLFRSLEDHLDNMISPPTHFSHVVRAPAYRKLFERRMNVVCDTVEGGDEIMYRLSEEKLLKEMLRKAHHMVEGGLPASLEDKFVTKALEVPVTAVKRHESSLSDTLAGEEDMNLSISQHNTSTDTEHLSLSATSSLTSMTTLQTSASTCTSASDTLPTTPNLQHITQLLRLRTALHFLTSNYLPLHLCRSLTGILVSQTTTLVDFTDLDAHLSHLSTVRQEALASRSLADFSRKRSFEDVEGDESRAEKKRKKEEEERKKRAGESRAVRDLRKADVSGMRKLSDFFGGGSGKKTTGGVGAKR